MRFKFFFKSLQMRIIIIYVFLVISVVITSNNNFSNAEDILKVKTSNLILSNLALMANKVENVFFDITKLSNSLASDNVIISNFSSNDNDVRQNSFAEKDILKINSKEARRIIDVESQMNNTKFNFFFNYSTQIVIVGADGLIYASMDNVIDDLEFKINFSKSYRSQEWYKKIINNDESAIWLVPSSGFLEPSASNDRYLTLIRTIKSKLSQNILGILMVNFSQDNFDQMLDNNSMGEVYLLNEDNGIIFCSKNSREYENLFIKNMDFQIPDSGKGYILKKLNNEDYMMNYFNIKGMTWKLVSVTPYKNITTEMDSLKAKTYALNFIMTGIFLLIGILLILYFTNPLKRLVKEIRNIKIGDYIVGMQENDNVDDVSGIVNSVHLMINRIKELVNIVIEEQKTQQEIKYEALKAQINPHFLFNTLNTIKWSAMMSGASNVSTMISSLGVLLEASMNKGSEEITFKEEMALIEAYIYIQNIRYKDRYKLMIEAEEEVQELKVLKFLLQPLVENSIFHGLKDKDGEGMITITAFKEEEIFKVNVSDNGKGINDEKINEILNMEYSANKPQKFNGIGLVNVLERIKLKYGKEYGFEIFFQKDKGTTISLKLPVIL